MRLRGIDTNLIVALRALLVHRNVTRAGKEVGLSQSSMSHALELAALTRFLEEAVRRERGLVAFIEY